LHHAHTPTVRQLPPLLRPGARPTAKARIRLAAAALIAGAGLVAAPSIANADTLSTCVMLGPDGDIDATSSHSRT
jgi:hypothetical protein